MSHNYYNTGYNSPHSQPSPGGLGYNKQGQPPYSNNPDYQYAQPHQGRQSANSPRFNGQNGSPRGTVTPAYTKGHREQESSGINPAMRGNLPGLKSLNQSDSPHSPLGMGGGASPRGVQSMQQMTRSFRDGEALHSRHHRGTSDFDMRRSECLRQGVLFEDNDFLPEDRSIYYSRNPPFRIEWRRPKDIASQHHMKPEFFVDNASRFDVKQGYMGDCWVVSAIACLSSPDHRELFRRVVPADQGFHEGWYAGIFRFNFWYFGKWVEVIVDDRLPTDRGQLLFVHSSQPNEFWAALLEKAYAKLYGSYEALKSGNISEALTDFTGGICESYILRGPKSNVPRNIVNIMFKALDRQSLIGCGINNPVGKSQETTLENGLVTGHAYSITDLREILLMTDSREMPITLIRIRNPWGTRVEWSGAWGDRSRDWQNIPQGERERMGLVFRDDGEFWMEFQDFLNNFDSLDMCNLTPDSPIDMPKQWHIAEYNSRWQRGFSAGGRANNRDTHWCNPQFRVSLSDIDEDGDDVCSFIIQLMQKDGRRLKQNGKKNLFMGFYIYQIGKNDSLPLKKEFFETNRNVADSKNFIDARQIIRRLVLQPGQYVIVPCTWDRDEIADFYLRFFFENKNMAVVVDEDAGKDDTVAGMVGPVDTDKEDNFKHFFYQVSGEDMEVDAFELQSALNEALRKEPVHRDIGIDACKSFVTLMDVDNTGKLGFTEFLYLWNLLRSWKRLFYQFDMDKSGRLSSFELRRAINAAGFKVSNTVMQHLVFRYADQKLNVSIDGYFICLAKLMKLMNDFNSMKSNDTITLNLNQWLEKGLV